MSDDQFLLRRELGKRIKDKAIYIDNLISVREKSQLGTKRRTCKHRSDGGG